MTIKRTILITMVILFYTSTMAQFPDVEMKDIDQNWISLEDLKGEKLTVLDFWATWCKPCVSSIPKLNNIYNEYSTQGIEFIGVNVDGPRNLSKVKPFARSMKITYALVLDPDQNLVDRFNVTVFPTMIVLDEKGKEVFIHEGFNPGDEQLIRDEFDKLLK